MSQLSYSLRPLILADIPSVRQLLADACRYDPAALVADEKLLGDGPALQANGSYSSPRSIVAVHDQTIIAVAAIDGARVRMLAVAPAYRRCGVGTALLTWCRQQAVAGATAMWAMGQAGNYLAPGIDERNIATIEWLTRRGWHRKSDIRTNLIVALHDNPLVSAPRAHSLNAAAADAGYTIQRARPNDTKLLTAIAGEFGGAWPFEVASALAWQSNQDSAVSCGVHVAMRGDEYCAFAAHDGNNRGAGWFGPAGTWPAHRGKKLGEAVLIQCLLDVAIDHTFCEIAWIGPEAFYQKSCGISGRRTFVPMYCQLAPIIETEK